ncbi:putative ATP-dependent RNA helicase ddx47 [Clonorchis sinensis]|uniref:RNA helicase n=1 Tax=Clonorchis sinensis TaxID=79923 RepID=A0A8T1MKT0_CLOSI|nr:putative ATP-dependent RNA helicase ddx47 [Clonorchis sinensis]
MSLQPFAKLGICQEILDVIKKLGWSKPSEIQAKTIPQALRGKDVVGLAETGSGKTAAFAIPILQDLISKPKHNFALVLTPTRELALQLKSQFMDLGEVYGLRVICLVGGQHIEDQTRDLKVSKYHIIIGTPGRICYHLENSKDLRLNHIRYLVLDEADQMLEDTFEDQLSAIIANLPPNHRTYLYSATLSPKVQKLQEICTRSPIIVEVSLEYSKVKKLDHAFVFIPEQERDVYLVYALKTISKAAANSRTIVFTTTWRESFRIASLLNSLSQLLGGKAVPLNGAMQQDKRQNSLFSFRAGQAAFLVATDLASRGLDIPDVDLIINYDVPRRPSWSDSAKAYIHRVGRTARAGRSGRAITLVTPYSATRLKAIEAALGECIPQLPWPGMNCVGADLREQISAANRQARESIREKDKRKRILKKKRLKQKERKAESFADPVKFQDDSASSDSDAG